MWQIRIPSESLQAVAAVAPHEGRVQAATISLTRKPLAARSRLTRLIADGPLQHHGHCGVREVWNISRREPELTLLHQEAVPTRKYIRTVRHITSHHRQIHLFNSISLILIQ